MQNKLFRKVLIIGIIISFVGVSTGPSTVSVSEDNRNSIINQKLTITSSILANSNVILGELENNIQGIVWDNGMNYDSLVSAQWDPTFPYYCYIADDFQFEEETFIQSVKWVGGYWGYGYDEAELDWYISFMKDDGTGNAPDSEPQTPSHAGPYSYTWAEIEKVFLEEDPEWAIFYEMLVDFPETVTFNEYEKYWISIWAEGQLLPQSGWGCHNDSILLHQAMCGSDYWSLPFWTNIEELLLEGLPADVCFQLIDGNPLPTVEIIYPSEGQTVSGMVTISGIADDPDGTVQLVEVKIDTGEWNTASGTTSWAYSWDTTQELEGWHTIYAMSFNGEDYSEEDSVNVNVDNEQNDPPETPDTPTGDTPLEIDEEGTYITSTNDPNNDQIRYGWDWDDGGDIEWTDFINSGETIQVSHSWSSPDIYYVKVKAEDEYGNPSGWSNPIEVLVITPPEPYYFIHLTDTHVGTTGGLERFTYVKNCILNSMNPPPKFIVISGDCTHWGNIPWKNPLHWWNEFFTVVQDFEDNGIAVYITMGNHDHFPELEPNLPDEGNSWLPASNLHLFGLDSGGTVDFVEGWKLIWIPLPPPGYWMSIPETLDWIPEANGLNQGQVNWLSNHINDYPSFYKVVFMHHPVFCDEESHNYNIGFDETIKNGCIMNNRNNFINLVRNNVDIVLGGHIHGAYEYFEGNENTNELDWLEFSDDHGYHGSPGWGYWSLSDLKQNGYDLPVYILTGACSQNLEFRMIEVTENDILVHDDMRWYEVEDLVEYKMDTWQIIFPWKGKGTYSFDDENISAAARLHLYDSNGNHVGINDNGDIDFEIPDAYYEDEPIFNETTGECINWTDIELINVLSEDESFTFEIEGILNCSLNLTGSIFLGESGGEITIIHNNVTFYEGSIGQIEVSNNNEVSNLKMDYDGDGTIDEEIEPDIVMVPPDKPETPDGPMEIKLNQDYEYKSMTVDSDGDEISYFFDWGDGSLSGPLGPYQSGETVTASHKWSEKGDYLICVQAIDSTNRLSDWSDPLDITVTKSKNRIINSPFLNFLQNHPHMFPILQRFLRL